MSAEAPRGAMTTDNRQRKQEMYLARNVDLLGVIAGITSQIDYEKEKAKFDFFVRLYGKARDDEGFKHLLERNLEGLAGGGGYPSYEMVKYALFKLEGSLYKICKDAGIVKDEEG